MKNMQNFFADEMKKFFPDKSETEIIHEYEIKPEDIFIVQEEKDVPEVKEVLPSKKPVDKPVYLKRQELVPKDVINKKKKKTVTEEEEEEDTIQIED